MDSKTKHIIKPWVKFYQQAFFILYSETEKIFETLFSKTNKKIELFSIALLLKKIIELAYGQYSLVKNNEFLLIKSFNRESFECYLLIKYIGDRNTTERAIAYQIHSTLEKIKHLESLKPGHPSFNVYNTEFSKHGLGGLNPSDADLREMQTEIDRLSRILDSDPLKEVYQKYFLSNPPKNWFSFENKQTNTLKTLSRLLNEELFYLTHYSRYSEYIHGYNLLKNDIITYSSEKEQLEMYQTPSPPFELAKDYLFFERILLNSIVFSMKALDIEKMNLHSTLFKRIQDHFNNNGVVSGRDFIDKNRAYFFPRTKK